MIYDSVPFSIVNGLLCIGDDSVAEICKTTEKPYIHTRPSPLRELGTSLQCPSSVYKEVSKAECHAQYQTVWFHETVAYAM